MPKTLTTEELEELVTYLAEDRYAKVLKGHFIKRATSKGYTDWPLANDLWGAHQSLLEIRRMLGAVERPEFENMKDEIRRQLDTNEMSEEELSRKCERLRVEAIAKPYKGEGLIELGEHSILAEPMFPTTTSDKEEGE